MAEYGPPPLSNAPNCAASKGRWWRYEGKYCGTAPTGCCRCGGACFADLRGCGSLCGSQVSSTEMAASWAMAPALPSHDTERLSLSLVLHDPRLSSMATPIGCTAPSCRAARPPLRGCPIPDTANRWSAAASGPLRHSGARATVVDRRSRAVMGPPWGRQHETAFSPAGAKDFKAMARDAAWVSRLDVGSRPRERRICGWRRINPLYHLLLSTPSEVRINWWRPESSSIRVASSLITCLPITYPASFTFATCSASTNSSSTESTVLTPGRLWLTGGVDGD
mmetsp:Transcript_25094/g.70293  ORF Transcript_25094/g.70293 Transcript_25094/m.70293 type:complete len:280 (-) Transcript_25094:394-1233(-)